MNMFPYNHAQVETFSKEKDYVIHTFYGQTRIAGLFQGFGKVDGEEWLWVTAEGEKVIPGYLITHWAPINF